MSRDGVKTGGRQKGTPNKDTQELKEIAERLGVNPFEVMLLFAKGDWQALGYKNEMYVSSEGDKSTSYKYTIDPATRAKMASDACQFMYPKRKSIEVLSAEDGPEVGDDIKKIPRAERIALMRKHLKSV